MVVLFNDFICNYADAGPHIHGNVNTTSNDNKHEQISWAELERDSQDHQQQNGGEDAAEILTDVEVRDNNWRELLNASQQAAKTLSPLPTNGDHMVGRDQDALHHNEGIICCHTNMLHPFPSFTKMSV